MTSFDIFRVKKECDESTQILVSGFTRAVSGENAPRLVVFAIVEFYGEAERFVQHNTEVIRIFRGTHLSNMSNWKKWDNTTYGRKKIYFDGQGIHEWRLKMVRIDPGTGPCLVGIDTGSDVNTSFHQRQDATFPYVGYNGTTGRLYSKGAYGRVVGYCKTGDIARIEVNLNRKVIGFAVNDGPLENVNLQETASPYRLAVSMCGGFVELLSYKSSQGLAIECQDIYQTFGRKKVGCHLMCLF